MSDLTQTFRRFALPRRRPGRLTILLLIAAIAYGLVSWMILNSAGNPPVRFRIDVTPFLQASFVIKLHVLGAVTAFAIGVVLLRGVKGSGLHRKLGYTWVAAMAVTAATPAARTSRPSRTPARSASASSTTSPCSALTRRVVSSASTPRSPS